MKKYSILYLSVVAILIGFTNCEEVFTSDNEFLGQTPETVGFPMDSIFSTQDVAERVLTTAYSYGPYPFEVIGNLVPGSYISRENYDIITDMGVAWFFQGSAITLIYPGVLNSNTVDNQSSYYIFNYDPNHYAIRYANYFLENVDNVTDYPEDIKTMRKGEAHLILGMSYFNQLREVGGTPWVSKVLTVDNMPEKFERMTVEQQVNRIDSLLVLAASELPWYNADDGDYARHTKASALGLRVRVLLEAARPLFNNDTPYHPDAKLTTWYGNYDASRWERAKQAGKDFMDALDANGYYNLIQPKEATHDAYRQAFFDGHATRMNGAGNTEALITAMPVNLQNGQVTTNYAANKKNPRHWHPGRSSGNCGTLEAHNMFGFMDGTDFPADFDWDNPPYNPWWDEDGNASRDPRLYESFNISGDKYLSRYFQIWNTGNGYPRGRDNSGHLDNRGVFKSRKFVGEFSNADFKNKPVQHSYLRLPEVFLAYAEAINETNGGPDATAYDMVNRVRNRVGLPDLTPGLSQEEFRAALIRERALEFYYEDVNWFDIKFWKQTERLYTPCHSLLVYRTDALTKITNKDQLRGNVYKFEVNPCSPRVWWNEGGWDNKWLMWPFPQSEIDKNYGLVQNPGW